MKLVQVLSRLALLSLAAAVFVGLTESYGGSIRISVPDPHSKAVRGHRPSAPKASQFPEFAAGGIALAIFGVGGRLVLRLRLSPVSPSKEQPILLDLHERPKTA
jgi:hypothetical protein